MDPVTAMRMAGEPTGRPFPTARPLLVSKFPDTDVRFYFGAMTMHSTLPSEVEPTTIGDLIDDCRELTDGALRRVIDLTGHIPVQRVIAAPAVFTDRLKQMVDDFS